MMTRTRCTIVVMAAILVGAWQAAPPKAPPGCRTYSTHETRVIASPAGLGATVVQKCEYNKSANEFTCRGDHRSSLANYSYELTFTFARIEDFLGDPDRIILFGHPQRMTMTHKGPGSNLVSRATYTYDASGRLTRLTIETPGGKTAEVMTSWDTFGRPTAATAGTNAMTYAYDDVKRTGTLTNKTADTVVVKMFDINGIEIGEEQSGPAGKVTNKWTIHSTAMICK